MNLIFLYIVLYMKIWQAVIMETVHSQLFCYKAGGRKQSMLRIIAVRVYCVIHMNMPGMQQFRKESGYEIWIF